MATNQRTSGEGFDIDRDNRTTGDLQQWIEANRSECGLIYVKRADAQGDPLNFVVDVRTKKATSGDWSFDLHRPEMTVYLLYHRLQAGSGNVWTGRYVRTIGAGDRRKIELADVRGPTPVAMTFRELTGVKEAQTGIRYARRTPLEAESPDNPATEADQAGLPDSEALGVIKQRRGQLLFRKKLLVAWHGRCAVTECAIVDLLEAAHIKPHREGHNYQTSNGLLLRADIHTLFDLALLSIDETFRVHVAPKLARSEYARLQGKLLAQLPTRHEDRPSAAAINVRHKAFLERCERA